MADISPRIASLFRDHGTGTQAILRQLALIGVVVSAACQRTAAEAPVPAHPLSESLRASNADSICRQQSGISFQLQISTPRYATYGRRPVAAVIGPDSSPQPISPEYLMATQVGLSGMPNRGAFPTGSSGLLPITIFVTDTLHHERQLASLRMQVLLRPEWLWFVLIRIEPDRTSDGYEVFTQPMQYRAMSLANGDSLYVYVVGQSTKGSPAIF